jgi:hypothetical protein
MKYFYSHGDSYIKVKCGFLVINTRKSALSLEG